MSNSIILKPYNYGDREIYMAKLKVLLVDDEQDFREVLAQRMVNRGLDVDTAESGRRDWTPSEIPLRLRIGRRAT